MVKLNTIVRFLNKELKVRSIKDSSRNGLQVKCKVNVNKIGFAVDGSLSTFEKAKKAKVDLLIVHHGVKWKFSKEYKYESLLLKKREQFLKKNKISLYGVHLPLDASKKYGNNAELAKILELNYIKKFGRYHGSYIGYTGIFDKVMTIRKIANILNKRLHVKSNVLDFGTKKIKSIGIVSGGGANAYPEAIQKKIDCFVTGEINHTNYNSLKDSKINVIIPGHYATETLGVKALQKLLKEKFKIETIFIDNPTGL